ncbi:hypothetical protein GCM10009731_61700 [Streptomyces globosus]
MDSGTLNFCMQSSHMIFRLARAVGETRMTVGWEHWQVAFTERERGRRAHGPAPPSTELIRNGATPPPVRWPKWGGVAPYAGLLPGPPRRAGS